MRKYPSWQQVSNIEAYLHFFYASRLDRIWRDTTCYIGGKA